MSQKKILVVYKESAYSRYLTGPQLSKGLKQGRYWDIVRGSHERHNHTLSIVRETLVGMGLAAKWVLRDRIQTLKLVDGSFRLVITVGGDGTLLDTSHHLVQTPVLGVNSDPRRSVARFSGCNADSFAQVLSAYLAGKIKPALLQRLELSLGGHKNKWLVLNDLLVAAASPAATSRYVLRAGSRMEEQLSSGIWVSTAAGSTAAALSAGGKALPVLSDKFQFVVREAYQKKFGPRKLLRGVLGRGQKLEVVSYMKEGRVFVDGANLMAPFRLGERLEVRLSQRPLKVIGLRK